VNDMPRKSRAEGNKGKASAKLPWRACVSTAWISKEGKTLDLFPENEELAGLLDKCIDESQFVGDYEKAWLL
jgi:hypothetical protein